MLSNKLNIIAAFIIDGETVYREFMPYTEKNYLTEIEDICKDADAYFPSFNKEDFKREIIDKSYDEKLEVKYSHILSKRRP